MNNCGVNAEKVADFATGFFSKSTLFSNESPIGKKREITKIEASQNKRREGSS